MDACVIIANWPSARQRHWEVLTQARAIENQCYVVAVNRIGEGDGLEYIGGSLILDPWGARCDTLAPDSSLSIGELSRSRSPWPPWNWNGSDHSGHNPSDHSGDNDSDRSGHNGDDYDDDQGENENGDRNLVLVTPEIRAAVANATSSVPTALSSGSLRTSSEAIIPVSAQAHTYSVLIADPTLSASSAVISAALSTAGPEANAIVPSLMRSFSGLGSNPANLPSVISRFNRFAKAASDEFVSNPPPEFLALHTVLARLTAAASSAK